MKKAIKWSLRLLLAGLILLNISAAIHAYKFTHYYKRGEKKIKRVYEKNNWDRTKDVLFGFDFEKHANAIPDTSVNTFYLITKNGLKLEGWSIPVANSIGT